MIFFHSDPKVLLRFGNGEGDIVLNDIQCGGTENNLLECITVRKSCYQWEDPGISCGIIIFYFNIVSPPFSCYGI